jgi:hypothetical protein
MDSNPIHQYYYLWSVIIIVPLWAWIVYRKKESRVEIIYMGILMGASAMGLDRYCSFYDYWRPPTISDTVNIESFLYGFFWGGISTKLYEWISGKEYLPAREPNSLLIFILVTGSFFLYMLLLGLFRFNSVDIYIFLLLIWTIVLLLYKKKFIAVSIGSGICMAVVTAGWYAVILLIYPGVFRDIWLTNNLSGILIFNVPIEEHVYIFSLGCFGSIMYKVATDARVKGRPLS